MKTLAAVYIFVCLLASPEWSTDFEKAKVEATQSHKFVLLNFSGSDWCGPCIRLKKEIFESEAFKNYAAEHLVLVRADFPRLSKNQLDKQTTARNETLAERYNQEGKFPLTVLLDANGKVVREWDGFPKASPEAFVNELKQYAGN